MTKSIHIKNNQRQAAWPADFMRTVLAAQRPPAIEAVPICLVDYGTYPLAQNDTSDDDAALFELVERYQIANADYVRLGEIAAAKLLIAIGEKHPKPEVLRIREADRGLGLPQPAAGGF